MNPIVGWSLGGPVVRPEPTKAWLGEPTWSRSQLLRDLEMRLGLPLIEEGPARRVPAWAERLAALMPERPFYARSFEVDRLGTARALLEWRDGLVEAGWDGTAIADGGERLATFARLEALATELPPGRADRLAAAAQELAAFPDLRIYESLRLVEPRAHFSRRWRSVFALLEARGTRIEQLALKEASAEPASDLGALQRSIRGERLDGFRLRGDGSLLVLRGDTAGDLAELTAALVGKHRDDAVVVRCGDEGPLEAALARHGLPLQGHTTRSLWRPAMQILPLALELAYDPRDPYRVLELLTLPVGPFRGAFGAIMARAVSKQPGIGGTEWLRQKEKARAYLQERTPERADERFARLGEWLEQPGAPASGASRTALLEVVGRVATFLRKRLTDELRPIYAAAHAQASAMNDLLARDARATISRDAMRTMLDGIVRSADAVDFSIEGAGRVEHVNHPAALLWPARTVVFWSFVTGGGAARTGPWLKSERRALEAAGVAPQDPTELLRVETAAWRRGLLAASERVILVIPRTRKGEAVAPHPTWDEIAARLGIEKEAASATITRTPNDLLAGRHAPLVPVEELAPLALPASRGAWELPPGRIAADSLQTSPTALEKLASCPLRFVLAHHAKVRGGAIAKVASGPLLNGSLGHRLVEELHKAGAFAEEVDEAFEAHAKHTLQALVAKEGATLLLDGASFELAQLVPQLLRAMRSLRRYLAESGWRIAGVEEQVTTDSDLGTFNGRLDVRLERDGEQAVLDLKWGASTYRALLEEGRAVQLAAYVHGIHAESEGVHSLPPAAYFVLSSGKLLTADTRMSEDVLEGATLDTTWKQVERTATKVRTKLREGKVPVAATRHALPLLDALGVPEAEQAGYYALEDVTKACDYCELDAICGRAWEGFR